VVVTHSKSASDAIFFFRKGLLLSSALLACGFIEAESCFSIYKPSNSNSLVASFEISQTNGELLIIAIRNYLSLTQNVTVGSTNNFKIKVSSVRAIENVIKFIQKAPVKLLGYKKLQYLLWIKELRSIERYTKKFNIPQKY
jgi:ubiquinol-cytochrome c reductase cytochrome b subunit